MKRLRPSAVLLLLFALFPWDARAFAILSSWECPAGTGAAWKVQPTPWYLMEAGYSEIDLPTLETVLEASMDIWSSPCCSSYSATYLGHHGDDGLESPLNVVYFEEETWHPTWGHPRSVIAFTAPKFGSCEIVGADIVFNGVGFLFDLDGSHTDLQAVATHEFGHWIGLGHSETRDATMFYAYQGPKGRDLGEDDEAGACFLYPAICSCEGDEDCKLHERCGDQQLCEPMPCGSHGDCPATTACLEGACALGCRIHSDCGSDEWCSEGMCVQRFSECTVCDPCSSHSACGDMRDGFRCFGTGAQPSQCSKDCSIDADCPGDSVCLGEWGICGSPDLSTQQWFCEEGYRCELEPYTCDNLGASCTGPDGCGGTSDTCIELGAESVCSCTCDSDADCGEGGLCASADGSWPRTCFPKDALELCGDTHCLPTETRGTEEMCRDLRCGDTVCGATERCVAESCVDLCENLICGAGETCEGGVCLAPLGEPVEATSGGSGCSSAAGPRSLLGAGLVTIAWLFRRRRLTTSRQ